MLLARPMSPKILTLALLSLVVGPARFLHAPALPVQDPAPRAPDPTRPDEGIEARVRELRDLKLRREWEDLATAAALLRGDVEPGSDVWFEASAWVVVADYKRWRPEELERVARESLRVAAELRRRDPASRRSALGPLHPVTALAVAECGLHLAWLLQHKGHHEDALGHLRLLLDDLQSGQPVQELHSLTARLGLAAAWSLMAVSRQNEARGILEALRDQFGEYHSGAQGAVILGALTGEGYRGRYSDDSSHAPLRAAVLAAVAPARARLAAALGWPQEEVPTAIVGVVDRPGRRRPVLASTHYDARRPAFSPVIMCFAEVLPIDNRDPEELLVHELAHAALGVRLGAPYDALPQWLVEGLPSALAGQLDHDLLAVLEMRLREDGIGFAESDYWERHPLMLESPPGWPSDVPGRDLHMLALPLAEAAGGRGVQITIERLLAGDSLDEALRRATGMDLGGFEAASRARLLEILQERRQGAAEVIFPLLRAEEARDYAALEQRAREALAGQLTPLGEGWAMQSLASALMFQGRYAEAEVAWGELIDRRREHRSLQEVALEGRARSLIALGRDEEAAVLLRILVRGAGTADVRASAGRLLRETQGR